MPDVKALAPRSLRERIAENFGMDCGHGGKTSCPNHRLHQADGIGASLDNGLYKGLISPEDVSFLRISEPLPADDVLAILSEVLDVDIDEFKRRRHSFPLRAIATRYLIRYAGQSQRDVADLLNVGSGSAVCKQLNRLPEKLSKDRRLRRQVKQGEAELNAARIAQAETKKC